MGNLNWIKKGVLIEPNKDVWWMTDYAGPSYIELQTNDKYLIYVTGRDKSNVSRIGVANVHLDGERLHLDSISPDPILDVGLPGSFDESGVSYPWIMRFGDLVYMYYVGWVSGGLTRFQNYTGMAISNDGGLSFNKRFKVPILDRNELEPFGSGSCSVVQVDNGFQMLYTSFYEWIDSTNEARLFDPSYDIKIATSRDGIEWKRDGVVAINHAHGETIVGKPTIRVLPSGLYEVLFSARGNFYNIYSAIGPSLDKLVRDSQPLMASSTFGQWDSEMMEYGQTISTANFDLMIYNGNQFGKTGLGYAIARGSDESKR